jgi:hypothetical protein
MPQEGQSTLNRGSARLEPIQEEEDEITLISSSSTEAAIERIRSPTRSNSISSPLTPIPNMSHICHGIYIGNLESSYDPRLLIGNKISAILSVISSEAPEWTTMTHKFVKPQCHMRIDTYDRENVDIAQHFKKALAFIHIMRYPELRDKKEDNTEDNTKPKWPLITSAGQFNVWKTRGTQQNILIHCREGVSRSATIVIAYLIATYGMSSGSAYFVVKASRGKVEPNVAFMNQLHRFEQDLKNKEFLQEEYFDMPTWP